MPFTRGLRSQKGARRIDVGCGTRVLAFGWQVMDCVKDLVVSCLPLLSLAMFCLFLYPQNEANLDCSSAGIALQAMDSSHVSLVAMFLRAEGFQHYRADRSITLGLSLTSVAKILKIAGDNDIITLRAEDAGDSLTFLFESPSMHCACCCSPNVFHKYIAEQTRLSSFGLKLMDIDSEVRVVQISAHTVVAALGYSGHRVPVQREDARM